MTTKAIGEDIDFQYNAVPEVTVLDTEDRDKWTVDWHHAHLLPENGLWEVGLFFRAYVSEGTKKVGFGWVLESLVLHGRQRAEKVTSSLPVKRTKNHFAAYGDMEQERAKRRRRRAARKGKRVSFSADDEDHETETTDDDDAEDHESGKAVPAARGGDGGNGSGEPAEEEGELG